MEDINGAVPQVHAPILDVNLGERGAPSEICLEVEPYPLLLQRRHSLLHVRQKHLILNIAEVDFDIRQGAGDGRVCQ